MLKPFQEWDEGRIKENDGQHEFKYDIRNFVNLTMCSQHKSKF
jgi:hypothetical protein